MLLDINPAHVPEDELATYSVREAARAVIFDKDGRIALMNISKEGWHKLPGGGIEENETPEEALSRECLEEVGVSITKIKSIGTIREVHKNKQHVQQSYCYEAYVQGDKGEPHFSSEEAARGFKIDWLRPEEAINCIKREGFKDELGQFIFERELAILANVTQNSI